MTEKSPEALLAGVRAASPMSITAGQTPVTITGFRDDPVFQNIHPTLTATPVDAVDGGDGSHATAALKLTDYVWKPFVAPVSYPSEADFNAEGTIWNDTPATQTENTNNDTATVAANALTLY